MDFRCFVLAGLVVQVKTVNFRKRPDCGVRHDDPDGAYYFINDEGIVQLIIVGAMIFKPVNYSIMLGLELKRQLRIFEMNSLKPAVGHEQECLDRGYISIGMM